MRGVALAGALLALLLPEPAPASLDNKIVVKKWASDLGDELWQLNEALTRSSQITQRYKKMNASVKKKDGEMILESSLRSVSTMLTGKINAVKCIHGMAKILAKEYALDNNTRDPDYQFCSSKYSHFIYETGEFKPEAEDRPRFARNNSHYLTVNLEKDSHFYEINVTTNLSCVHVPTNIFYQEPDALNAILWTRGLNDVFIKNYKADPSLSWQYFGTAQGVLRFYPGMPWNDQNVDTYDCRVRTWYIEAATCSKDVIILFDVSGSMTGFKNYVARQTLKSLLSTLSNNDYVNVFTFKNTTNEAVRCFQGLVQATQENINTIINSLEPIITAKEGGGQEQIKHKVELEGNANLEEAYKKAFSTLEEKRNNSCSVSSQQGCNQMVMVITDYVPGNLSEVFEQYNRKEEDGKTYIPVRVFTYLIGKEVTNVQEIQSMACNNRGYFVHIHSVEEVQQQVLKYINVIARPMILRGDEPPPTWTHANIDDTRTNWKVTGEADQAKQDEDKLVTSVAIPAFHSDESNENATLLGVAGTDVPIDSIAKLAQPHQLGVNGYPLIVSNNGFLLLHPLLVATINGKLQDNFNSVDFVEVEQVDDGKGPRELGKKIRDLRHQLVNATKGSMPAVEVLYHYDKLRRIARVKHDYFFNELRGTPFSMGISLPVGYGDTELSLRENPLELKYDANVTNVNVTDYFTNNFRVHPDWVYCKYHYLEGHEAVNAENEIWRFLVLSSHGNLDITKQQYAEKDEDQFTFESHCGDVRAHAPGQDDYYCTEDLVKQLVFDGKLTAPYFKEWTASKEEWDLARAYNVSVRFIATSSGLTRWHYIFDDGKNEKVNDVGIREKNYTGEVFGDVYHNSIEETWYKAAVLQHMIRNESLVVATRLPILDKTIKKRPEVQEPDGDIIITTSFAIFYRDNESGTPASVVGSQYSYLSFYERFTKSVLKPYHTDKNFMCGEKYHCYIVDSSAYVVMSVPQNLSQVGMFFGVVDINTKLVMKQLMNREIFSHVEVFNYQALCPISILQTTTAAAWSLTTPFSIVGGFMRWLFTELVLLVLNWNQYAYATDYDHGIEIDDLDLPTSTTPPQEEAHESAEALEEEEKTFSCDHNITLYLLNQNGSDDRTVYQDVGTSCSPPFWASYVRNTNLLLVVIEQQNDYDTDCPVPPSTVPHHTDESIKQAEPCHKLNLGRLKRRRLEGCFTYNDKESNITLCGDGSAPRGSLLFLSTALLASLASRLLSS